ncbi:UDP-N-acetylglucosamine 4,6-dehydratase [Microbulbifer sediminum]|uniref:UDP-N-acetylglucosamine 4,6-dehydratase n=1 Tax=Microbulbifer sediminum TaxID=2904250 RepID=UPI001F2D9E32|nr:UDP-N-acetylglucosamine 4,6-dehydratase [Microbulbifer sediminum]
MTLSLIGRENNLFQKDIKTHEEYLSGTVEASSFLVIGGAGSIGQAVVKELFKRSPKKLHVVDISENNLTELVRDVRSSLGYIKGDFRTFCLDLGSIEYDAFMKADGSYDYVFNLSALKHVRSEKDPYTLMRMIDVNILNTDKSVLQAAESGAEKYFCVSTDKATNPVNMMGASKRIMELFLMRRSKDIRISTARFANVAFSDGSLLHGFNQRLLKAQPIVAPNDIKRYFITPEESGQLCLLSCLLGENRDVFFPKLSDDLDLISFSSIAEKYLKLRGYKPYICSSEEEARSLVHELAGKKEWPCLFTRSDTTGEKDFEEFFSDEDSVNLDRFNGVGIIKNDALFDPEKLEKFEAEISRYKNLRKWDKSDLLSLFVKLVPEFSHQETGKYLDGKM